MQNFNIKPAGLGNSDATLVVYIGNKPPLDEFVNMKGVRTLRTNEIQTIGELTGNHWRKIFNCYAKLAFEINPQGEKSWQNFRDQQLLTASSNQLLLFSPPNIATSNHRIINLVCGKTYFNQLTTKVPVEWIDNYFAISFKEKLIVSPYFDYRQLSNQRISDLVCLIKQLA